MDSVRGLDLGYVETTPDFPAWLVGLGNARTYYVRLFRARARAWSDTSSMVKNSFNPGVCKHQLWLINQGASPFKRERTVLLARSLDNLVIM